MSCFHHCLCHCVCHQWVSSSLCCCHLSSWCCVVTGLGGGAHHGVIKRTTTNDEAVLIHCLVATSLSVMWHLDSMSKKGRGDEDGQTHLVWMAMILLPRSCGHPLTCLCGVAMSSCCAAMVSVRRFSPMDQKNP